MSTAFRQDPRLAAPVKNTQDQRKDGAQMGENGTFRTSFSGFHKGDVLNYIDALQARQAQETAQLQEEAQHAREQAGQLQAQLEESARLAEEAQAARLALEEENTRLRQQADEQAREEQSLRLRAAAAEDYQREIRRLNERLREQEQRAEAELQQRVAVCREEEAQRLREARERADKLQRELEELRQATAASRGGREKLEAALKESEDRCQHLRAAVAKYEDLVGDVGGFIMEIRAMGQHFLETTYKRSEQGLEALDDAVSALERQLADNRAEVEQARQDLLDSSTAAGLKLEELMQGLEESAAKAPAVIEKGAGEAAGRDSQFFR